MRKPGVSCSDDERREMRISRNCAKDSKDSKDSKGCFSRLRLAVPPSKILHHRSDNKRSNTDYVSISYPLYVCLFLSLPSPSMLSLSVSIPVVYLSLCLSVCLSVALSLWHSIVLLQRDMSFYEFLTRTCMFRDFRILYSPVGLQID